MTGFHSHADPPATLAGRLGQLNDTLQDMAARLKDAIASAVGRAVAQAVRDAVRALLGEEEEERETDPYGRPMTQEVDDPWYDPDAGPWRDQEVQHQYPATPRRAASRWVCAARAAVQAALWWLRRQPRKRPALTTALVAVAAGGAALFAGPTLAACVGVAASAVGLLLTADSARSAAEMFILG